MWYNLAEQNRKIVSNIRISQGTAVNYDIDNILTGLSTIIINNQYGYKNPYNVNYYVSSNSEPYKYNYRTYVYTREEISEFVNPYVDKFISGIYKVNNTPKITVGQVYVNYQLNGEFFDNLGSYFEETYIPYGKYDAVGEKGSVITILKAGDVINFGTKPQNIPSKLYDELMESLEPYNSNTIELYRNTAENNRVDKTDYLTSVTILNGTFRNDISVTEPTVLLEFDTLPSFNYVYIKDLNRYYFVEDIVCNSANLYEVSLKVDVLMSYKDALLKLDAFIDRNENEINENIIDDKRVIEAGYDVEYHEVANEIFTKYIGCYLITGMGFNVTQKINLIEESENNVVDTE